MIVISAGMRKAGTAWLYNMTNDLLVAAGFTDVRAQSLGFPMRALDRGDKCKTPRLDAAAAFRMGWAQRKGLTFPVKTHDAPGRAVRWMLRRDLLRATYVYRDPRDVIVSVLDHATASRKRAFKIDLDDIQDLPDALALVQRELARWEVWMRCPEALAIRYEDLVSDTVKELKRMVHHLNLAVPEGTCETVAARYQRKNYAKKTEKKIINSIHLNKGVPGRFRTAFSPEERARCEHQMRPYLTRMGYTAST